MKIFQLISLSCFVFCWTSCGAHTPPVASQPVTEQEEDRSGSAEIAEAELRRVLFDEAELGWLARRPLYMTEAAMAGATLMMRSMGGEQGAAQADQMLGMLAQAGDRAAELKIPDKIWAKIYETLPRTALHQMYEVTRHPQVQRCGDVQRKQLGQLLENPEALLAQAQQGEQAPPLSPEQRQSIDNYVAGEMERLKKVGAEIKYWTALSTAYFMHVSLETELAGGEDRAKVQRELENILPYLKDEQAFLAAAAEQVKTEELTSEYDGIFRECQQEDAAAYWAYTSAPENQDYFWKSWQLGYEVIVAAFRAELGI